MSTNDPTTQSPAGNTAEPDRLDEVLKELQTHAPFLVDSRKSPAATENRLNAKDCPDVGSWLQLVCGGSSPEEQRRLLAHAAVCTSCLEFLRESQRVLSRDVSPEELGDLEQFQAISPQWQHRLAVELAHTPHRSSGFRLPRYFGWSVTGLATALMLLLSVIVWRRANAPDKLLAEAYSQSRSFDLRLPGAGFAPVSPQIHLRGGGGDHESAPLLSARAAIERKLERSPNDPQWLQLQARAQILGEQYDQAIDTLDRLVAAGPVTPSLLLDDGSAYFLRGTASGSENDRATALDYLRRADELDPSDPVVLFNEALMMEDRGQVMNAVETWNRYLKFEHNPQWQEEGRARLKTLENKLDKLKTHESRMEQHLATPQSMRALAADSATLAGIDEELTTNFLPRILDAAYPLPVDRSRGSPCNDNCMAARALLNALASSLEHNHQDSWLTEFLPSFSSPDYATYAEAAHDLGQSIDANLRGDYPTALRWSIKGSALFQQLRNTAGVDRILVERMYALARSYSFNACKQVRTSLIGAFTRFRWIDAQSAALNATCDEDSGSATANNPSSNHAAELAQSSHYMLLQFRARNLLGGFAVESGDTETAWRMSMPTIREFYAGDYPAFRAGTTIAGLAAVEDSTPRTHLHLLLCREEFGIFSMAPNKSILAETRTDWIRAAIRAGSLQEAREQLAFAQKENLLTPGGKGPGGWQTESEINMAELYIEQQDLRNAASLLDDAHKHLSSEDNSVELRSYAVARSELDLALGHPDKAETTLRNAILKEEMEGRGVGRANVVFARQNRELYANLVGAWLAQNRPAIDILALWERYRLRILGEAPAPCADKHLDCLRTPLEQTLKLRLASKSDNRLIGQIILRDRVLLYEADAAHVTWHQNSIKQTELLGATEALERVVTSPLTSEASSDQAAQKVGRLLLAYLPAAPATDGTILLETDPILGNLPWPAVQTSTGPIGLRFNLEETPSLLLDRKDAQMNRLSPPSGRPLVIGASAAAGQSELLPEALQEAHAVALTQTNPDILLASQATAANIVARLASAPIIHFAGHATEQNGATHLLLAADSHHSGDAPYLDDNVFLKDPPKAARLVVFSACTTGRREAGWDHGMGDIVDTLESLGVPEVVATRWQIDSASAVPMMDVFYRGLSAGQNVPKALTAARQSLFRDPRYRHPYYWAAYYASGVGTTNLHEVFHGSN